MKSLANTRWVIRSASACVRKLPAEQFPTKVRSSTGMWSVLSRCSSNPLRDRITMKLVGAVELVGLQPGARTTYAVLAEAGIAFCGSEDEPGGIGVWNAIDCQNA